MARHDELTKVFLGQQRAVSTSRLGRLLATGRSAGGLAATLLRGRDGEVDLKALAALTERLGQLRGLGMKLGQIISFIDPSLPPEAQALLGVLQRHAPASETAAVEQVLRAAFGEARAAQLWASMEATPVAVASIGQVHRARLEGYGPLAVKVRHPGIADALRADFGTAVGGVQLANALTLGMAADARALVDEARTAMLEECDFTLEADHQRAFGRWLGGDAALVVPEVIDAWSTEAVLTTRWEPGLSLEAFLAQAPTQAERDGAGAALFRASVGGFYALGLLHADPHPGNFAFRDGKVVLYDFGCVRRFSLEHRKAFGQLPEALRRNDREGLLEAARRFGFRSIGDAQAESLERFARAFFFPLLTPGPHAIPPDGAIDLRQAFADKRAMAKLGLPRHLLFLLRLRFGLYAVLSRLGARLDWGELEREAWAGARSAA
jgi:predicted unusual protein kinase regulating ubiquinone biosynthesis (AarF/ABC1/UbiB family)